MNKITNRIGKLGYDQSNSFRSRSVYPVNPVNLVYYHS